MMLPPELSARPFTRAEATSLGVSAGRLQCLLDVGDVRRVLRNVYAPREVPDTVGSRARAAGLVLRPHAVICDRTAAWIWGVDTFDHQELEILPPLEVYALRGRARVRRTGCRGGERDLLPGDIARVDGVRVTTPVRTALDLACKLGRRDALAALDGFMRVHGLTRDQLKRELAMRYFRRRGVVQARRLVAVADGRAESPGESWTRVEMLDHGLPAPELQWWVTDDGRPVFRLDLAYPRHKVAVEFDGRVFHEGDARSEHDRERRKWLGDRGWTVVVVTKDHFTAAAVDAWVQEVRGALRLAA